METLSLQDSDPNAEMTTFIGTAGIKEYLVKYFLRLSSDSIAWVNCGEYI